MFPDILTMVDVTPDGCSPSDPVSAAEHEEEEIEDKPSFCLLLKSWTIYYITLTFALLAIFRFKISLRKVLLLLLNMANFSHFLSI